MSSESGKISVSMECILKYMHSPSVKKALAERGRKIDADELKRFGRLAERLKARGC